MFDQKWDFFAKICETLECVENQVVPSLDQFYRGDQFFHEPSGLRRFKYSHSIRLKRGGSFGEFAAGGTAGIFAWQNGRCSFKL